MAIQELTQTIIEDQVHFRPSTLRLNRKPDGFHLLAKNMTSESRLVGGLRTVSKRGRHPYLNDVGSVQAIDTINAENTLLSRQQHAVGDPEVPKCKS